MVSSAGQKHNYSQLLPAHCLPIWKPLEGFDVLAKIWVYKRWEVRVGRRADSCLPWEGVVCLPCLEWVCSHLCREISAGRARLVA